MKKIIWIIVIILIIWAITALVGTDNGEVSVNDGPIKIGFIGPLTGDAAAYGEPTQRVADIAVDEINGAGGIDGRQIEMIYEDGKCDGKEAATAAQKLVNIDNVDIIVGIPCSGESFSVIPIGDESNVLMLSSAASSPNLSGISDNYIRFISSDAAEVDTFGVAISERGWSRIGILNEQTDYAADLKDALKNKVESMGGEVVVESFTTETADFRTPIAKLKNANLDAVYIAVQTPISGGKVLQQMTDSDWSTTLLLNDVLGSSADLISEYSGVLEGSLTTQIPETEINSKLAYVRETYGEEIPFESYITPMYDLMYVLKDAMEEVGYDVNDLANQIRDTKNREGASGLINIEDNGDRAGNRILVEIRDGVRVDI